MQREKRGPEKHVVMLVMLKTNDDTYITYNRAACLPTERNKTAVKYKAESVECPILRKQTKYYLFPYY
jgi:hypothetical protein